jgi:DNA-binding NarL/FixJ family response regulator
MASRSIPAGSNAQGRIRWNAVGVTSRVLIVDDNRLFLDAARVLLEREGMHVVGVAATSGHALEQAEELQPDVALVDIALGRESGLELSRRLAGNDKGTDLVVILMSTYSEADFADLIAESPAAGFLPKPELSAESIRRIIDGRASAGQ